MSQSWSQTVNAHAEMVVRSVRRILGNDQDAEDVAQEVFLEAYRAAEKMEISNWGGFLRKLAMRRAIDKLRVSRQSHLTEIESAELCDRAPQPHQTAAARELSDRLRNAIALLPNGQAEAFALRYFEEMTYEQIAETLAISSNAVGMALNKARCRLQKLLAD